MTLLEPGSSWVDRMPLVSATAFPETKETAEQRRTHELDALDAVATAINRALAEPEALAQALQQVLPVLNLASGQIYLWDANTAQLSLAASQGDPGSLDPAEASDTPGEWLHGQSLVRGLLLTAPDIADAARGVREGWRWRHEGDRAAVPLAAGERLLGVLCVARGNRQPLNDGDLALLRVVAAQMGVAVENLRLRAEAQRAEALTALIQEMHHRIKNNLQTVADLLSLEMSSSPSPAARKSLRDSIGRIKSIAAVHEFLSLEHLRLADVTELARQVCDNALRNVLRPDQHIQATVTGPPIFLPSKQATALALVLNELIANALEHAFSPARQNGQLDLALTQDGPRVTVTVADDGRGLPSSFDLGRDHGLGLQIVRTLVEKDLAGALQLENRPEGGSRATLTFYK